MRLAGFMKLFPSFIVLLSFSSLLFAGVATQTNWSGGPGVSGPIFDFEDEFMSSTMIDINAIPGRILLLPVATRNSKTDPYDSLTSFVYPDSGILESSILDTQLSFTPWAYLHFSMTLPQFTSIGIQIRASDDYNEMGPWSEIFMQPGNLYGVLDESANYVQYRAILYTANSDTTPALKDVSILYTSGGTAEFYSSISQAYSRIITNPSAGPVEAELNLLYPVPVEIFVFDLSGRLVNALGKTNYESGRQTVMLGVFSPGVYSVHIRLGELSLSHRFVVVN